MSSTQHQLIEQCATRLRGIVEALDNIHDSTPHPAPLVDGPRRRSLLSREPAGPDQGPGAGSIGSQLRRVAGQRTRGRGRPACSGCGMRHCPSPSSIQPLAQAGTSSQGLWRPLQRWRVVAAGSRSRPAAERVRVHSGARGGAAGGCGVPDYRATYKAPASPLRTELLQAERGRSSCPLA